MSRTRASRTARADRRSRVSRTTPAGRTTRAARSGRSGSGLLAGGLLGELALLGVVLLVALLAGPGASPASAATPSAATPPAACPQGLGIGLADVPSGTSDPRAQNYIVDHVAPGSTFNRRFQVCNGTASAVTVQLYAAAAQINGGGFNVLAGRATNELSQWITISPSQATLAPGARLIATATFTVPRSAVAGERYTALLAELPATSGPTGVRLLQREGVRVYLDAGPGGDPVTDFAVDSLQAQRRADGTTAVLAVVHNTGRRAVDLHGSLQLADGPGGLNAGPFAAQLGTTLKPGDSAPVTFVLDKAITGGPWHAVVDLVSGQLDRKATGELSFALQPGALSAPVAAQPLLPYQDRNVLIPIAAGLVVLLLILLVLLARGVITVSRRDRTPAPLS